MLLSLRAGGSTAEESTAVAEALRVCAIVVLGIIVLLLLVGPAIDDASIVDVF